MAIVWTKYWQGVDDGTVLQAIDLRNIQDDISTQVVTTDDVLNIPGQTQGDIIYFNGSIWTRLGYGTAGQMLTTQGVGANPIWQNLNSGGTPTTGDMLYWDGSAWVVVSPAEDGSILTSNGVGVAPSFQGGSGVILIFTADDTWTCPTGITTAYITMVGAGGGGATGAGGNQGGGGGGSGATKYNVPYTVTPAADYDITVGVGGATASNGEDTVFDSVITASGGGGAAGQVAGAAGVDSMTGQTIRTGGLMGSISGGVGGTGGTNNGAGGAGSMFGVGGTGGEGSAQNDGEVGTGYGSGGGGGSANSNNYGAGAAGQDGVIILMY